MEQNKGEDQSQTIKPSSPSETQMTPRQVALQNLQRLSEAAERFSKAVENGTIAPPTSAGRWK